LGEINFHEYPAHDIQRKQQDIVATNLEFVTIYSGLNLSKFKKGTNWYKLFY